MVTIALKRVENPLEFGVVVVNEEGRIERFLEKPTWGQVFSDTVNTGIYVLEPEVFDHIPADTKYDFSQELFPKLFEMGAPLYGYVAEGYWQDIGSLPQYLAANRDLLDGKVQAELPGIELHNRIFLGDGVNLDSLENMQGPAFIGNYVKIDPTASIGAYSVLGSNVVVKEHAETRNSVIGANTYVGASAKVLGAIIGRNCDLKAGATFSEGVAVGDESVIGEQAYIAPDVKIYPYKTVESGAQINSSIIWESRGSAQLFGKDGITGLINVDITAELALKMAMAYGTVLKKGARVTHEPRRPPGVAGHQARHHLRPQLHRRRRARPARREQRHQPLRGQERQRPGRHPRAHRQLGPGDDPDPAVRAAGHQPQRGAPEGHREVLRPPGLPPRLLQRVRRDRSSRTGPWRPTCAACSAPGTWSASAAAPTGS